MNPENVSVEELDNNGAQSVALVGVRGLNRALINHLSEMTYEVTCGNGTMEVDFEVIELRRGVVVTVPKGTPYQDEGEPFVRFRATATPPFNLDAIEFLD